MNKDASKNIRVAIKNLLNPDIEYGDTKTHLNWFDLKFSGSESRLEKTFQDKYFYSNLNHLRNCHLYTIFFYTLAGFIDYLLFPQNLYSLFAIRFLVVVPVFILGFLFTFSSGYKKKWQSISFFYILLTGGSFITFTIIGKAPEAYDYYVGIFFCLVFGYTFIRERFIYASVAGFILLLGYFITAVVITKIPDHTLILSLVYLTLINFLGMVISRHLEISARKDFYLESMLSKEQEKVLKLNNALEEKVAERTLELDMSNKLLQTKIDELHTSEFERNKLETQLRQAHKMEAIGTLAGGIAHDFNNILSGILGYCELLEMNKNTPEKAKKSISRIHQGARRAADLVKQILSFSRDADYEKKPLILYSVVQEAMILIRSSIPVTISIEEKLISRSPIMADPAKIHQVIMNLCTNAYQAMSDTGGTLSVHLTDIEILESQLTSLKTTPGRYIKFQISDTGHGIDKQTLKRIFDPYFTTKEIGKGTGMGLSIVYAIVREHGGHVEVLSTLGRGTTFEIYLPVTHQTAGEAPSNTRERILVSKGQERILVVDDEESILQSTQELLSDHGCQVTAYADGKKALEAFYKNPHGFDLVVTDMTMPGITGDVLAKKILKVRPELPIILCTGYNEKISQEKALEIGIKKYIQKPIVDQPLIEIIHEVISS